MSYSCGAMQLINWFKLQITIICLSFFVINAQVVHDKCKDEQTGQIIRCNEIINQCQGIRVYVERTVYCEYVNETSEYVCCTTERNVREENKTKRKISAHLLKENYLRNSSVFTIPNVKANSNFNDSLIRILSNNGQSVLMAPENISRNKKNILSIKTAEETNTNLTSKQIILNATKVLENGLRHPISLPTNSNISTILNVKVNSNFNSSILKVLNRQGEWTDMEHAVENESSNQDALNLTEHTSLTECVKIANLNLTSNLTTIFNRSINLEKKKIATDRISYKKCIEYSEAVYEFTYALGLLDDDPLENKIPQCGFVATPLITNGTESKLMEFPHMARVGYMNENKTVKWACGGSLISNEYVLTAAHCLYAPDFGAAKLVRLGELDFKNDFDGADVIDVKVAQVMGHPKYDSFYAYHDIGLIRLDKIVDLVPAIRPACLPEEGTVVEEKKAIATGWGQTVYDVDDSNSNILLKVVLDIYENDECKKVWEDDQYTVLEDAQFCAGSKQNDEKDTCQGDSGGPFQIYHPNEDLYCMYTLVGVTSFGISCGLPDSAAIYTNIVHYLDWIEGIVWPNEV